MQVGYNREGIEAIVQHLPDQIVASIRLLHRVFVTYHYVSLQNVCKAVQIEQQVKTQHFHAKLSSLDPPRIFESYEIEELYRPFAKRCSQCTLYPPCGHVSLTMMIHTVEEIWYQYPNREGPSRPFRSSSLDSTSDNVRLRDHRDARWYHNSASRGECISFVTTGICSSMSSRGRCQFEHPPNLHAIDKRKMVARCSQHTLPVPCFHCEQLLRLRESLKDAEDRFEAAKSDLDQTKMELARLDDTRFGIQKKYQKARNRNTKRAFQEAIDKSDQDISRLMESLPMLEQQFLLEVAALNTIQQKVSSGQTKGSRVSLKN
uniref:Uncharacterized protein AlNc14C8G1089 n=1 Tax=Albugo laibachii Nc14 TaxID=890382 RepID=F0W211_9STRA|nr:hypothetical protein PITG_00313 [Albugo laibachii Nc14]|eukprot:CCA15090.1 hypothetical protein PITG_00313 [Albugo laibachii Nc14]